MRYRLPLTLGLALLCASLQLGCDDGDVGADPDTGNGGDTGDTGDTGNGGGDTGDGGDTDEPPAPGTVLVGDLCDADSWCASGFCVKVDDGYMEGVCSRRCSVDTDCELDGWECMDIVGESSDQIRGCVPNNLCIDRDGDGYGIGSGCLGADCDDTDGSVHPGAPERCDGKDNDCNGIVDDNPIDAGVYCETGLPGVCADGTTVCTDGVRICQQRQQPSQELCDGLDNDCDGLVDEGVWEDDNGNFIRELGQACTPAGASCANGVRICDPYGGGMKCDGLGDAAEEICDGIDNNCDGQIDEGIAGLGEICTVGEGVCVNSAATICDPTDPNAPPICDIEPNWAAEGPEVCDYQDNNCDGTVDEGFVDGNGIYHLVEHCGSCTTNCNDQWGDIVPADVNAIPSCQTNPSGNTATCGFSCAPGYVDADDVQDNGCELQPDLQAIYVAPVAKGGTNTAACGTWDLPCATIAYGISRATADSKNAIRLSEGIFREGVTVSNGISILGGHSSLNWLRDPEVNLTIIYGSVGAMSPDAVTIAAQNITSATTISGLNIVSEDAPAGGNSIGLFVQNSTSALVIENNDIQAGVAGRGTDGAAGTDGSVGANGGTGNAGDTIRRRSNCSEGSPIAGGAGGTTTCNVAGTSIATHGGRGASSGCAHYGQPNATQHHAVAGQNNSGDFGASGFTAWGRGYPGDSCYPHPDQIGNSFSSDGLAGRTGTNGTPGSGGTSAGGTLTASMWRGNSGGSGAPGTPGGGGGGGGATHGIAHCDSGYTNCHETDHRVSRGPTGGGGGAGGCPGAAAQGGAAGGASFALYLLQDGSAVPTIRNNLLTRGQGGVGGTGGLGGTGAFGGAGGTGGAATYDYDDTNYCADNGRTGGDGGRGGHGGGGGGGAGGYSYDVAVKGLTSAQRTALQNNNDFGIADSTNTAGPGGSGGASMGNDGENGQNGQFGRTLTLP